MFQKYGALGNMEHFKCIYITINKLTLGCDIKWCARNKTRVLTVSGSDIKEKTKII